MVTGNRYRCPKSQLPIATISGYFHLTDYSCHVDLDAHQFSGYWLATISRGRLQSARFLKPRPLMIENGVSRSTSDWALGQVVDH